MPDLTRSVPGSLLHTPAHAAASEVSSKPLGRFMGARDIGLFLRSARSDAQLGRLIGSGAPPTSAFDQLYAGAPENDPWASASPRYRYQRRKYDGIVALLPDHRRFRSSLDLGCGIGLLARRLTGRSDAVLGLDISAVAVGLAREQAGASAGLTFEQADLLHLDSSLNGRFDLVVIADSLYYLPPAALTDAGLKALAARLARLLTPNGILVLANHYFSGFDSDSRRSQRIHNAFHWSPALTLTASHRRAFWIASLLSPALPA